MFPTVRQADIRCDLNTCQVTDFPRHAAHYKNATFTFFQFVSATLSLTARFPRRGIAGKSISPMITGRDLSAPSPVCGQLAPTKRSQQHTLGHMHQQSKIVWQNAEEAAAARVLRLTVLPLSASYTELQSLATSTMMQVRLTCSTTFRTLKEDRLVLYRS